MLPLCLCVVALVAPRFQLLEAYTDIRGLSAKGKFACGSQWTGTVYGTAVWPQAGEPRVSQDFAVKQYAPIAVAVNDAGDAVAHLNRGTLAAPNFIGYRWLKGDPVEVLKTFAISDQSWPRAMARDGSFIAGTIFGKNIDWPVVWKRDGSVVKLRPTAKKKGDSGEALGLSGNGRVIVGHLGSEKEGQFAVVWTDLGPPKKLADLQGGRNEAYAWVANYDGSIIAGYASDEHRRVPARWVRGGPAQSLGAMPPEYESGMARGITDDGSAIVGLWGYGETARGFVWTASTGMVPADKYLASKGLGSEIAGLKIATVMGVSADGHTMAGECFDRDHHMHGWIARL